MIEGYHPAGHRHMLADKGEISALKLRHGREIRPGNHYIVESNDPSCLIDVRSRFHPKHTISRRVGACGSNGHRGARFEVASFPFFDGRFENTNFDAVVFKLARPTQLFSVR